MPISTDTQLTIEIDDRELEGRYVQATTGFEAPDTVDDLYDCAFIFEDDEYGRMCVHGWAADRITLAGAS